MKKRNPCNIIRDDLVNALKDMDSYIDVTVEDLMRINDLAQKHARLRQLESLVVKDLMTSQVVVVSAETPLADAAQRLLEHRISGLPVVDNDGALVGIITEADFLAAMGIPCHHATHTVWQSLEALFQQRQRMNGLHGMVADIMIKNVVTINAEQTLHDVIETMKKSQIKRLVVTDAANKVMGIVTRSNLVRVLLEYAL